MGLLIFAQVFFILLAADGSYLVPGTWAPFQTDMLLYLTLSLLATGPLVAGAVRPIVTEGSTGQFLRTFSLFCAATWILMTVILLYGGGGLPTQVPGTFKFQYMIFIGFFVGPTEELIFRVVLPPLLAKTYVWQLLYSSLAFGAFHLPAYTASGTIAGPSVVASSIVQAVLIGAVIFLVVWKPSAKSAGRPEPRYGYAAGVGLHVGYDLTVLGVIGGLALVATHLGLTWV